MEIAPRVEAGEPTAVLAEEYGAQQSAIARWARRGSRKTRGSGGSEVRVAGRAGYGCLGVLALRLWAQAGHPHQPAMAWRAKQLVMASVLRG